MKELQKKLVGRLDYFGDKMTKSSKQLYHERYARQVSHPARPNDE